LNAAPKISVVIPHFNGIKILEACLKSLYKNRFKDFETILIDNGSTDGSQEWVKQNFPQVQLIENNQNKGYAGGCNQGIRISKCPLVLLLNNDTEMPQNFLEELYESIKTDQTIAAVQPKILSIQNHSRFDYSGAAGGELDIFGYPFARGRIFDRVEEDLKQYDDFEQQVFWTSGCALLLRKDVVDKIGYLDEDFFAHQEEIDWNWRAQLAGYKNIVTTNTYIFHYSGYTLQSRNEMKMYLNHRNNLIMMIKNFSAASLIFLFPVRILMELTTILMDAILWGGKRSKAVAKALYYIVFHPGVLYRKHRDVKRIRKKTDREIFRNMFKGSIVWNYFIKKSTAQECIKKFRKRVA